ncbi:MAG: hypothetical protein JXB32_00365 [Deltaproteobacteria bacterium]|nr:hypothetical protein [Deltaproteobacteria bacterium]
MDRLNLIVLAGVMALGGGCGKKSDGGGAAAEEPAPFEYVSHKVERLQVVAPNQTYIDQGLGVSAPEGHVFVCVQYAVTNRGTEASYPELAQLRDAKGALHEPSVQAAGSYQPPDWTEHVSGKLEPGATSQETACYDTPTDAAEGSLALVIEKQPWGKHKGWKVELPL